jgi:outer membrane protein OmpA-like peptidoglycan-associated protein/ABC-type nitrate/sulfonate/bicarbonate transport system substrate-binding protein
MNLTPFAKTFITLVVLSVIGYVGCQRYGQLLRCWSSPTQCPTSAATHGGSSNARGGGGVSASGVSKNDFAPLGGAPADPGKQGVGAVAKTTVAAGKLTRPLRVGINTWAGHAPGIVANQGLKPGAAKSIYKERYGVDVELVLLDDPAAKLAAFQAGQIDVMWDTVDSWAREAAVLAEGKVRGRAILMEDWSRGGDGIAALATIKSVEDLAGKKIATTEFTPSHWLLLYLLSQSGLTPEQKAQIETTLVITQDAPAAAAMFKSGRVDAAVTWEPDLSGAVSARGAEAHVLVSTTAATNVIADVLVARQEIVDDAPATLAAFVGGWFEGIEAMKRDPYSSNLIIGNALKLDSDTVSGMLSGLKLTPFADNAQFFGMAGTPGHFATLFETAFRIWRKKGVVTRVVDPEDCLETRFVGAVADRYRGQEVVEPQPAAPKLVHGKPSSTDVPIINKTLSINFTPGSDEIMPGSFFTLDSLGETMVSFGQTYLRIEGNTDATGSRRKNVQLSEKRSEAVKAYLVKTFNLPAERFQTLGHGPDNPVASNATEAGRQLNRRTDIKVVLAAP